MLPLYVIRPEPGCSATVAAAQAMGLEAYGFPLFAVRPLAWEPVPADTVDALLIGSANALRHGGEALRRYRGKSCYAVGEATAAAARDQGFAIAVTGSGGLQSMLGSLKPEHRRLLRLAGRERVHLDLPDGVSMIEREVYASEPVDMPAELAAQLGEGGVVLLHSREAAAHFAGECARLGIARSGIALAALGPRIAAAVGSGWSAVACAARPDDQALLALARQMCQNNFRPTA
jgi:uroporphyrinogen-III synthase